MKAAELKKYLHEAVKAKLNLLGFKKHDSWYYKNINNYTYAIIISSLNYDNSFPTSFAATFGFVSIDKILYKSTGREKEFTNCKIGGQLFITQAELFENNKYPCKDYDIYTFEQAYDAINQMLDYFLTELMPNMNEFANILKLEEQINAKQQFTNDRFLATKLKYGLILAKLVNNPKYETLKNRYREILKEWPDWDKQELEKVIMFLDSHSQAALKLIAESPI